MKKMTFLGRRATRRKRGTARLFVLGAAVAATSAAAARPAPAQAPAPEGLQAQAQVTQRFDIPAGQLQVVAAAFTRATGLPVLFSNPDLGLIESPGVSGNMTREAALAALLQGTSVRATFSGQGVTLDVGVSEVVDVPQHRRGGVAQVPGAAARRGAVGGRHPAQGDGRAGRFHAQRCAAQRARHHAAGGRRWRRVEYRGRHVQPPRLQRVQQPVRGRRPRRWADCPRRVQPGAGRGLHGTERVGRGARHRGRLREHADQGPASGLFDCDRLSPYGTADQQRFSADFNWATRENRDSSWIGKSAFRLNALWQDGGFPGRDVTDRESFAVAPSLALGLGTPTRVFFNSQFTRQDNLPDYGIPGAAWQDALLAPTTVHAASPVDQSNFYGSVGYDYDKPDQNTVMARVEHDIARGVTVRNQTRYNRTHREAVVSAIQNVAAFNPVTELVTIARQGNDRENSILSNQTSLTDRFTTGRLRHAATAGVEITHEEQFAPTLIGLGTRDPVNIYAPNPNDPVTGYAPARTSGGDQRGTTTIGAYVFDTVEVSSRVQLSGGFRYDRYDTDFQALDATGVQTTDLVRGRRRDERQGQRSRARGPSGQRVPVLRHVGHASRHRQLHVERSGQQPEQPEREAAGIDQPRGRHASGTSPATGCR